MLFRSLAEFDMSIEYRPGRHNALADALSRKGQLAALEGEDRATRSRSRIHMSEEMQNKLKESVETDTFGTEYSEADKGGEDMKVISLRWILVLWKLNLCSKVIWAQEAPFEGAPQLTVGWPSRATLFFGIVGERVLLGKDAGGDGGVCTYVHHLSTGQIR